ncbi:MAG: transcriptional regulator [Candidatus Marinimicrobia bacterium]|nr:transcriptional regulator [Candidatus Neomarinimicrobiota bacterium]|tara:strand:- start:30868 stop:31983 length:1116 start_codon:yes stop_codon:yes gene_type:complete
MTERPNHIPYVNLAAQWEDDREELLPIIDNLLGSGHYVGGEEIDKFEDQISKRCEVKYAVALNSGTDALTLALYLLNVGKGDEVITPPNSFIASTAVIMHLGAVPVFVDVLSDQTMDPEKIEAAITKKTKAIMPVHLSGRICNMDPIIDIAKQYGLKVVEDAAQAVGSKYHNRTSGSMGDIGCFSTHPLKNLNACGDGGFLTTNHEDLYSITKSLRNHGMVDRGRVNTFGYVSRMDNLQATILNYRLKKLDQIIEKRRINAEYYFKNINSEKVVLPHEKEYEFNTYHTFVIQIDKRNELKELLFTHGIETAIHYPTPIHLQPAATRLGYKLGDFPVTEEQSKKILTLPINQQLTENEMEYITTTMNRFFEQ